MPINYFDIGNGVAGFSQKNYKTNLHTHFSIEAAFSLSGRLNISTKNHSYTNVRSVIIASNVPHTFSCLNGECQIYFMDPAATVGQYIWNNFEHKEEEIIIPVLVDPEEFKNDFLTGKSLEEPAPVQDKDNRIQQCLQWIEKNYSKENITISMISGNVFLSEGRLAHLFKEQIGISIHQYILWKKIEMAVKGALEGLSLTECAHLSGFTDSSHFSKTFKKMFGVYPSFAVKR